MIIIFRQELTVENETGLHARPASDLNELCRKYESEINIITEDTEFNPKSIISILTAGVNRGSKIILEIEGPDEEEAGKTIADFIINLKD